VNIETYRNLGGGGKSWAVPVIERRPESIRGHKVEDLSILVLVS